MPQKKQKKVKNQGSRFPRLMAVIHLPPLPGAPGSKNWLPADALQKAGLQAVQEARALTQAGFDGIILENFGDIPFYKDKVPAETVASLSIIAAAVREVTRLPIGINVLRNDGFAALAIASVTGCDFIRVNVLSGVAATDQGMIEGKAAELIRERDRLGSDVRILADVHVKHARSLSSDDIELAVEEVAGRGGANGVIVTGATTGRSVDLTQLQRAAISARHCGVPVIVGSGATPENLSALLKTANGIIVGSTLRKSGKAGAPLDSGRIKKFISAARKKSR